MTVPVTLCRACDGVRLRAARMADDNTIIEGFVKFREGKKVSILNVFIFVYAFTPLPSFLHTTVQMYT